MVDTSVGSTAAGGRSAVECSLAERIAVDSDLDGRSVVEERNIVVGCSRRTDMRLGYPFGSRRLAQLSLIHI